MSNDNSLLLASIVGPILIALSSSEYMNYNIWKEVCPTVVYLNGLILFSGGLVIVRIHNVWINSWPTLITVIGWFCLFGGVARMFFPSQQQIPRNRLSSIILATLFVIGLFLPIPSYLLP